MQRASHKEGALAGDDRPPQQPPREAPGETWERHLDPYAAFVGAFLRQVVTDALSTPKGTGDWTEDTGGWTESRRREAQAFLLDPNRLAPWIELTGADVDKMQGVLLRAAGLASIPQV
jgi:hypothetical protein